MTGIVVLNYQTWELSLRCMESICQNCAGYPYRIYLVDNASKNPMPEAVCRFLARCGSDICLIQAEENRGYAAGNNLGIAKALEEACDPILIANNDIVFQERTVQDMAQCLKEHPEVGIVGPKIINVDGGPQISHSSMRTGIREVFQVYTAAKKIFRRKWKAYYCLDQDLEKPSYVYHVSGCCFAISRECAKQVMPMDEGTVLYDEELILGIRMEQAGYRTWYEPGCVAMHQHGASTRGVRPFMYQCISQSELYYCGRYLGAKQWQLFLLYHYRRGAYLLRCIYDKDLRNGWKTYAAETRKYYQNIKRRRKKWRHKA